MKKLFSAVVLSMLGLAMASDRADAFGCCGCGCGKGYVYGHQYNAFSPYCTDGTCFKRFNLCHKCCWLPVEKMGCCQPPCCQPPCQPPCYPPPCCYQPPCYPDFCCNMGCCDAGSCCGIDGCCGGGAIGQPLPPVGPTQGQAAPGTNAPGRQGNAAPNFTGPMPQPAEAQQNPGPGMSFQMPSFSQVPIQRTAAYPSYPQMFYPAYNAGYGAMPGMPMGGMNPWGGMNRGY